MANALLDKFSQILAYVGDDGAKDGYYLRTNNSGNPVYSIEIRSNPLSPRKIENLVDKIGNLLMNNKPVRGFDQDIIDKTKELKTLYDSSTNQSAKDELINYISDYGDTNMRGGKRRKTRRRKTKRNRRKSLKTR